MLQANPHRRFLFLYILPAFFAGLASLPASAKVVVLTNRTTRIATATLLPTDESTETINIDAGDSVTFFYQNDLKIRYREGRIQREFKLDPSNAYFFTYGSQAGAVRLEKIGLGAEFPSESNPLKPALNSPVIQVKLLVDDDEPTHQRIWEDRLRKRFASAAEIIHRYSGIQFEVTSVGSWTSDDNITDFSQTLIEFEQKVKPHPAQLAIGFSSQYRIARGRVHMGGTRGPLHPYIMLKERSPQIRETERLELLVHELGHYLCAVHSPESLSVMKPVISVGQQRAAGAKIRFDPVNHLLLAIVGDTFRQHGFGRITSFPEPTKKRMAEIYGILAKALPEDPAAARFQQVLAKSTSPQLILDTRQVLDRLNIVAELRQQSNLSTNSTPLANRSDAITESYVRQAAIAAQRIKSDHASKAFLLALGIFLDDTKTLRIFPPTSKFVGLAETESKRKERLTLLGQPTMHGRRDLTKHFFVSAFLTTTMGAEAARSIGLAKELKDSQQGSGFSFSDITANQAGIIFAQRLLDGKLNLNAIANNFSCQAYLPLNNNLPGKLNSAQLKEQYDTKTLNHELSQIDALILELPIYQQKKIKKFP